MVIYGVGNDCIYHQRLGCNMIEDPSIIDPNFLKLLTAGNQISRYVIERKIKNYQVFRMCGWTIEEMIEAEELGYSLANPADRCGIYILYFTSSQLREVTRSDFGHWLKHHYRQSKAELLGLDLDAFVMLWRRIARENFYVDEYNYALTPEDRIVYYMRARRAGFAEKEALHVIEQYNKDLDTYIALRRKLSQEQVRSIIGAARHSNTPWILKGRPQNVIKALRRGASLTAVIAHVRNGTLHQFAQGPR